MKIKLGISLFLALLAFIFISQNTEMVVVDFLVWSVERSLGLLVFVILGTGAIIGWLFSSYLRYSRHRKQIKSQGNPPKKDVTMQEKSDFAVPGAKEPHE